MEQTQYAPAASGNSARKEEAGRWAEAFHKNVLAHHDTDSYPTTTITTPAEPQPSRRPAPHSTTTVTTTILHGNNSNGTSRSQSQSTHTSPFVRRTESTSAAEGSGMHRPNSPAAAPPCVVTSRPVAAVAVHPPLSRGSKRAALSSTAASARSASLPSATSSESYIVQGDAAAKLNACAEGGQRGLSPRPLPVPPPPPAELCRAGNTGGVHHVYSASATATPIRTTTAYTAPGSNSGGGHAGAQTSPMYTTPHMRVVNGGANKPTTTVSANGNGKAKPLSQLELMHNAGSAAAESHQHSSSSVHNSPVAASAATPHIPSAYASSPFFQRVVGSAPSSPQPAEPQPQRASEGVSAHDGTERDAAEDSALLQEVTPITHGGGSWRHDSQLLSQPREILPADAAPGEGVFRVNDQSSRGYAECAAGVLGTMYSQIRPPPPPPSSLQLSQAGGPPPMPVYNNNAQFVPAAAAAAVAGVAVSGDGRGEVSCWADGSPAVQRSSPYAQALLYGLPGYTEGSGANQCGDHYAGASPYTPGETTRLSASPGGMTGSHNTTTTGSASVLHGMRQAMAAGFSPESAAGSYLHASLNATAHSVHSALGGPHAQAYDVVGMQPSPPNFHSPRSYHSQSLSPYRDAYSAAGTGATTGMAVGGMSFGGAAGPVPTVSGTMTSATTATTTTAAVIASGLSGVALEKQLLHASKEELVQILLELGSCNPEASRFIDAKAFFFAFRHEHSRVPTTAANVAITQGQEEKSTVVLPSVRADAETVKAAVNNASETATSGSNKSIARCIFPAGAAEEDEDEHDRNTVAADTTRHSDNKGSAEEKATTPNTAAGGDAMREAASKAAPPATATTATATAPPPSAAAVPLPERRLRPEERAFCADVHPCLRWYGACRNATSCAYAGLPRNLCLNWVRGACVAHTECSGVHRLPEPCPPELQRIYLLNHGVSRDDVRGAMLTAASPSQSRSCGQAVTVLKKTNGSSALVEGKLLMAVDVAAAPQANSGLHTPHNQSLHKDEVMGGDSTPHRHPHGRPDVRSAHHTSTAALGAPLSPWSAMDVSMTNGEAEASSDYAALQHLRMSGAASPSGSSCSTVEDRTMSELVNRCLREEFDSVQSPLSPTCAAAPAEMATATAVSRRLAEDAAGGNGRRSPVVMAPCEVKEPLQVAPLRSVADQVKGLTTASTVGGEEEVGEEFDDYADYSAPAAGTRTRMQSPSYC